MKNQGKSLILEGVTIFKHEILNLKNIFGISRCQIRKIYYPKRLYTWGEVWERPATCRALVGLFFCKKKVVLQDIYKWLLERVILMGGILTW